MIILYILLIFIKLLDAHPEGCLLRCKDNYMHEMQSLLPDDAPEWSLNLVTPLQSLFYNSSQVEISKRLHLACAAHSNFVSCLGGCHESRARSIVELGQTNWAFICESLRNNREFHLTILPCWTNHGEFLSAQCHYHGILLQKSVVDILQNGWAEPSTSLEELCRTLKVYDTCFLTFSNDVCGRKGWEFLLKLNIKSSNAIIRMLIENTDLTNIPVVCNHWQHPKEYAQWHIKRITSARKSFSIQKLPNLCLISVFLLYFRIINV